MKIGIVITCYQASEYFLESLLPWFDYKTKHNNLLISACHACFKENHELGAPILSKDGTHLLLQNYNNKNEIDFYKVLREPVDEAGARNAALEPLLKEKVDYIWILDLDEIYSLDEIEKTIKFIENNKFTFWFKINFKNYVFDKARYIDDFCPPRIFRTSSDPFPSIYFYFDNDMNYKEGSRIISYKMLASAQIPRTVAFPKHYTWCGSEERLRQKERYQRAHFGHCSYKWNEEKNELDFDFDYYKKHNLTVPIVYNE